MGRKKRSKVICFVCKHSFYKDLATIIFPSKYCENVMIRENDDLPFKSEVELCPSCFEKYTSTFETCEKCGRVMIFTAMTSNKRVELNLCEFCEDEWESEEVKKLEWEDYCEEQEILRRTGHLPKRKKIDNYAAVRESIP